MKNVIVIKLFTFIASASMADGGASLAGLVQNPRPWLKASANSEQRQPYYIGLNPLEMELRRSAPANPRLPFDLKNLGEEQIARLAQALGLSTGEFEIWPAIDEYGQRTWAIARYKKQKAWRWLESDSWD